MNVLAIIQARGGSKGIPGKNIRPLLGKPLIAYTIEAAKAASSVNRVLVSTDDAAIATVARSYGAEVPFLRPKELASDTAKSVGLLKHALEWLKEHEGYCPDMVVQLKPVNPLRTADDIDRCVKAFSEAPGIDSLVTVHEPSEHPYKMWKQGPGGLAEPFLSEEFTGMKEAPKAPRQSLPEVFVTNSCVNVIRPGTILRQNSSIGTKVKVIPIPRESAINIDTLYDFEIAEFLMKKRTDHGA